MKKLPGSLEIKLHKKLSKSDILNILAEQMTMLEETFGIQEFKIFSYLECYIGDKKQALYYRSRNSAVATFKLKGLESPAKKYYNERLILFSIKGTDGKVGKIEIYTDTGELIFERYKTK